jgi:predicted MFS family arabinose efflux permease
MWQSLKNDQKRNFIGVLALALSYGMVLGHSFFLPRLVYKLGGSAADASGLIALSLVPVLIMATVGKRWIAAWSSSRVLRIGLALAAFSYSLYTVVPTLADMIPITILSAFGYAITFARLLVVATALVPRQHYGTGVAYVTVALQMGNGLGSLSASVLEPALGIHHVFWVAVGAALLGQVLIGFIRANQTDTVSVSVIDKIDIPTTEIARILVLFGALGLSFGVPLQFVPMWLVSVPPHSVLAGISPAYFLTTSFIAIMLSRVLFGHLLQGPRQSGMVMICFAVLCLTLLCLSSASGPWMLALIALAYGMSYSLLYPMGAAYVLQRGVESDRVQRSTWLMLGFEFGTKLLPLVFAFIADRQGFAAVFRFLAFVISLVGVWHVLERIGVPTAEKTS